MVDDGFNVPEIGESILRIARQNNCAAQVTIVQKDARDIHVRKGEIEHLLTSMSISTGIRLFSGKKSINISFSGRDFNNMENKIKTALEDMVYLEDDEARRLLQDKEFGGQPEEIDLDDRCFESISTPQVVETLKAIEARGIALDPRIIPSEMAEFSAARTRVNLFSSSGLNKHYARSSYSFYYAAVAEDQGLKEVDSWYEQKRYFTELSNLERIGETAAQKALRKLGGKKTKSGQKRVIFSARTASSILDLLAAALDGEEILLGNSFLVGKLGEKLFSQPITIEDNPLMNRNLGSYPFDGEGMNGMRKLVVAQGKLLTYLHNSYSAAKLKMELTGNASVAVSSSPGIKNGNFYLKPGAGTLDDLVKEIKQGILVDDLFSTGMNEVTGDFSFGCSGFMIENGTQTQPIKEITIAGNLIDLFRSIEAVADDNEWKGSVSSPSFLVSNLTIAGI